MQTIFNVNNLNEPLFNIRLYLPFILKYYKLIIYFHLLQIVYSLLILFILHKYLLKIDIMNL